MRISGIVAFTLLVGCGAGGGSSSPDAPPAPPDSTPIDAVPPMVTVTLIDLNGNPSVGSTVVFEDSSGAVLGEGTTDANGEVSQAMSAGSVHAILSIDATDAVVLSALSVVGGDHITIGGEGPRTSAGTFSISLPLDNQATSYEVWGPCGTSSVTALVATMNFDSSCVTANIDLVAVAKNAGGTPVGYIFAPNVAFTSGGSTSLTGPWASPGSFTGTYSNIPTGYTVQMRRRVPSDRGYITGADPASTGASYSSGGAIPITPNAFVTTNVVTENGGAEVITQKIDGSATTYSFDASSVLLPEMDAATVDIPNWTIHTPHTGAGAPVDAEAVHVVYNDGPDNVDWYIYSPDMQSYGIPILPADVGFVAFQASYSVTGMGAAMVSADGGSWDATRQDLLHAFDPQYRVEKGGVSDLRMSLPPVN